MTHIKHRLTSLLRWSEKYTKLDMVYFASGSFWQTVGHALTSIVAFGLMLIFANFLPKEVFGTYRYLLSLAGILGVFTLTGMSQAVAQAVATGHEGAFRTSVRYQLKWNLLLMLALLGLGVYYLAHENFVYTGALLILGLATPFISAFNTYGAYLGGKREFRLATIYSVAASIFYTGSMVAAIFWSGTVFWLVVAYAGATVVSNIVFHILTVRKFHPPLEPAPETIKFGRTLTYIRLMDPVAGQIDKIILNHFWGAAPLAIYAMASAIPERLIPLAKKWVDVGFPKVAVKTRAEINRTFYLRIGQGLLVGTALGIGWVIAAPLFFTYLMPQYHEAIPYAQILGFSFIFAMPNRYLTVLFNSQKMAKSIFASQAIQNIIRIALYLMLGIPGGILGLVIAQNIYNGLCLVISIIAWHTARPEAQ